MTSNEIAISQPSSVVAAPTPISISGALQEQVQQMGHAYTLAQSICKTSLVPQTFRGKPEDGAVAIMAGAKWGLDAISSLQNIFIVHGSPSTYARVMKAVVLANGHKIWTVESSPTKVVVRGKRSDSEDIEESVWTIQRAAPYAKTNTKYSTEPENMLYARATAECARRVAPDCLLGMPYSREEMEDARPTRVSSQRTDGTRISDSLGITTPPPEAANEPAPDAEPAPVDVTHLQETEAPPNPVAEPDTTQAEDVVAEEMITAAQLKKLHVVLGKESLTTDASKHDWLSSNLHREITSTKQLTKSEAGEIIDYLEGVQKQDPPK